MVGILGGGQTSSEDTEAAAAAGKLFPFVRAAAADDADEALPLMRC